MQAIDMLMSQCFTGYDTLRVVLAGDNAYMARLKPLLLAALQQVAADLDLDDAKLSALIAELKPEIKDVIELRFNPTPHNYTRLDDAATALGITRERARARESKGILALRTEWSKQRDQADPDAPRCALCHIAAPADGRLYCPACLGKIQAYALNLIQGEEDDTL